ncbi:MAG: hypothetical protein MK116_01500 [Phycisphaerales bacterium]|nr:hypothetical protein [Phycisphaerales bacterium]
MTMILPPGSVVANRQAGDTPFFLVRDGADPPLWSLRLESVPSDEPTAEAMIRRLMMTQDGTEPSLAILHDQPFSAGETKGHLVWVQEMLANNEEVIFGWMVLPQGRVAGRLRYLVATAITLPQNLAAARTQLEPALASISPRNPVLANLRARIEADATRDFLKQVGPDRLRSLAGHQSYRRVYRPGSAGSPDQEVAYSVFNIEAAPMGAIQVRKSPDSYTADEQEEGLLVRIHSRVVGDLDRGIYLDMLGLYWVAWDLSHEAWTANVTRRQGDAIRTEKEFGFRTPISLGEPRPRLVVIKQDDEINLREPYEWETPDPWMPRPLTWILGLMLDRDEPLKMSYAFFDHRHTTPMLGSRRDEWAAKQPGGDTWVLKTWLDDSGLPALAEYGPDGLIQQRNPDGLIIESTTPDQIKQVWDLAGLSTR